MGLGTDERNQLRKIFGAAFSDSLKEERPGVIIIDFMQFVKYVPPTVKTKADLIRHFVGKVQRLMLFTFQYAKVFIVLVDGKPVPVKRMIEHAARYKEKNVFASKKGPYLPASLGDLIPNPWIRFAGNYKLLRRELYPELFTAFMECTYFQPRAGQMLVLSGFPGRSKYETVHGQANPWEQTDSVTGQVLQVASWHSMELPITPEMEAADPDLYHRVYYVENIAPCVDFPQGAMRRGEWTEAKNSISEADTRMFYFDHWFQTEHILYCLNDGDIFSIGTLYAFERQTDIAPNGTYMFRNKHTALLPYKLEDKDKPADQPKQTEEYVDLNLLYELINKYEPFREARIQNAEVTMAFLLIMGGSDFFKDFLKGIGSQTIIWPVFFENASLFSHMIQKSHAVPRSTRTMRSIVIDEDMFRRFILFCYLKKYLPPDTVISFQQLQELTKNTKNGQKDAKYHVPDRNTIRLWCRQVEWNLNYWINAPFGFEVSPFETWHGLPYYPYVKDEQNKCTFVQVVAHKPKPVDQVYAQHMYAFRMSQKKKREGEEDKLKKRRVVDNLQHVLKLG